MPKLIHGNGIDAATLVARWNWYEVGLKKLFLHRIYWRKFDSTDSTLCTRCAEGYGRLEIFCADPI